MYEISFQLNIDKSIKQTKKRQNRLNKRQNRLKKTTVGVNDANDEMLMCDVRNVN